MRIFFKIKKKVKMVIFETFVIQVFTLDYYHFYMKNKKKIYEDQFAKVYIFKTKTVFCHYYNLYIYQPIGETKVPFFWLILIDLAIDVEISINYLYQF